jgi:hypothetical protein
MATLTYSGEQTVDVSGLRSLVGELETVHRNNSPLSIDAASMRIRGQDLYITVSVSASGTLAELESLEETVAQGAVDLGFEPDLETAKEAVDV